MDTGAIGRANARLRVAKDEAREEASHREHLRAVALARIKNEENVAESVVGLLVRVTSKESVISTEEKRAISRDLLIGGRVFVRGKS